MKIFKALLACYCMFFASSTFAAKVINFNPDSTGLPGDHFNLEGALELFKNSNSLEEFERKINTKDNYVNNLDLNEDGEIDYIKVADYTEGTTHAIVLQTPVSETESQDVAVIEIEKNGDQSALIQIVGDQDLYGEEKIVEPVDTNSNSETITSNPKVIINVWSWPSVGYVYAPAYVVYKSAWRWRYYPTYWRPWKPYPLRSHLYHSRPFRANYHNVYVRRVVRAPIIYKSHRATSVVVRNRYHVKTHKTVRANNHNAHPNKTNNKRVKTKVVKAKKSNNRGNRRK